MGASITLAGESLIAQKQGHGSTLQIARFVLAKVPGLDSTVPVDRTAGRPNAEQIVHIADVTQSGYLTPNQVVYSLQLGSDIGDFDFNWIGLETVEDVLLIAAYVPLQQKRREVPPLQTGNNLTRNLVLVFDGAQALTGVSVPASTWQFDFTDRFNAIAQDITLLKVELEKKVDAASWSPPKSVSLDGPVLVYPGSSNSYQITDFDAFSVYQVTTSVGTVTLTDDILTMNIPADTPKGLLTLEVLRGEAKATFKIPVSSAAIDQPVIVSPSAGATNVTFEPDLYASSFLVYPAGHDQHAETRWQIARDAAFTDLIFDQQGADNLTTVNLAAVGMRLEPSTRYYVRVQYHGSMIVSPWSVPVAFNTTAVYVRRPAIVSPTDGQGNVSAVHLQGDAFSVYGGDDTHVASRWQVSAVADFSTVLADSGWSTTDLISWTPSVAMAPASQFYARVQYRAAAVGDSEWSAVIKFATADPLAGLYTSRATGPSARSSAVLVGLDGYVYLIAGSGTGTVWRYDPAANSWRQMASINATSLQEHAAVAHEGSIYVLGGYNGSVYSDDLRRYDPPTNTWTTLQKHPIGIIGAAMISIGGALYAIGGSYKNGTSTINSNRVFRYDIASNAWAELRQAPITFAYCRAGVIGDRVYVSNCSFYKSYLAFYEYIPKDDTWHAKSTPIYPQSFPAAAILSGMLYLHGGASETVPVDGQYRILQEYNPATDTWRLLPYGGNKIYIHAGCELDGSMYIFGGADPTNTNALVNWFYRID